MSPNKVGSSKIIFIRVCTQDEVLFIYGTETVMDASRCCFIIIISLLCCFLCVLNSRIDAEKTPKRHGGAETDTGAFCYWHMLECVTKGLRVKG